MERKKLKIDERTDVLSKQLCNEIRSNCVSDYDTLLLKEYANKMCELLDNWTPLQWGTLECGDEFLNVYVYDPDPDDCSWLAINCKLSARNGKFDTSEITVFVDYNDDELVSAFEEEGNVVSELIVNTLAMCLSNQKSSLFIKKNISTKVKVVDCSKTGKIIDDDNDDLLIGTINV